LEMTRSNPPILKPGTNATAGMPCPGRSFMSWTENRAEIAWILREVPTIYAFLV
jgi:hypothetical protein